MHTVKIFHKITDFLEVRMVNQSYNIASHHHLFSITNSSVSARSYNHMHIAIGN